MHSILGPVLRRQQNVFFSLVLTAVYACMFATGSVASLIPMNSNGPTDGGPLGPEIPLQCGPRMVLVVPVGRITFASSL